MTQASPVPSVSQLVSEDDQAPEPLSPDQYPDTSHLVTEDDTPVDNFASEKLQRLLVEILYSSLGLLLGERVFLAAANVALYASVHEPAIVPDVFLSLDVQASQDWWGEGKRCYFFWEFGKAPEVVLEIVSNTKGGEKTAKMQSYARIGIPYYVIYDPLQKLKGEILQVYELRGRIYTLLPEPYIVPLDLGLTLWEGAYEGRIDTWLRWCDGSGSLLLTGAERAEQEHQRAEQERQRAEQERQRAERAESQIEALQAQLRALGVNPDLQE